MESSVLIAIVTAVASIIIALIQATASLRVSRLKEPPVQSSTVSVQPGITVKALSANRTWLWIGSILVITNFLWQLFFGDVLAIFFSSLEQPFGVPACLPTFGQFDGLISLE